jgi:hypothetical protein
MTRERRVIPLTLSLPQGARKWREGYRNSIIVKSISKTSFSLRGEKLDEGAAFPQPLLHLESYSLEIFQGIIMRVNQTV